MSQSTPIVLVIDVGGSNVKIKTTAMAERVKIPSGPEMTAEQMVRKVQEAMEEEEYDVISIGYPGVVKHNQVVKEPVNLGRGWAGFDFEAAFGKPTRVMNDAAMQALGAYEGRNLLFLGIGTGLGTALVINGEVIPMEAGHLPYRKGHSFEDYIGKEGYERFGHEKWEKHARKIVRKLAKAFNVDDIAIGGGNGELIEDLPKKARRVDNSYAFTGGLRLWAEA